MLKRIRGFTLIELLIVVAIIGILAALLIPNAITAMQKAKVRGTQKDLNTIATCMTDYMTDHGSAYTVNGTFDASSDFYSAMCPFYIAVLPWNDQWGHPFYVYGGTAGIGNAGYTFPSDISNQDYVCCSWGRDGLEESLTFTDATLDLYEITNMASFDHDLVIWNGQWVAGPASRGLT